MPRNASAIALKIYLLVALSLFFTGSVPLPASMVAIHPAYGYLAFGLAWFGSLVSLVGVLWPRTKRHERAKAAAILDGSVIEQIGLIIAAFGMLMAAAGYVTAFPMLWFPTISCGGFAITFLIQYYLIRKWRLSLKRLANSGQSATP